MEDAPGKALGRLATTWLVAPAKGRPMPSHQPGLPDRSIAALGSPPSASAVQGWATVAGPPVGWGRL